MIGTRARPDARIRSNSSPATVIHRNDSIISNASSSMIPSTPWVPLREDYFTLPDLSTTEKQYLIRRACEVAQEVVERARSTGGPIQWRYFEQYYDVQIYAGFSQNKSSPEPTTMCGITTVPGTVTEIASLFDQSTTHDIKDFAYDHSDLFYDGLVLYTLTPRTKLKPLHQVTVKWIVVRSPRGMKDRDFCYLECQDKFIDSRGRQGWVLSLHSIKLPGCPDLSHSFGFIRGSFYHTGIIVIESDRLGCVDIIHMVQINLKQGAMMSPTLLRERVAFITRIKAMIRNKRMQDQRYLTDMELIPKDYRSRCIICQDHFNRLLLRKYHCRKCGEVVCDTCSQEFEIKIHSRHERTKIRICMHCYQVINAGEHTVMSEIKREMSSSLLGYHDEDDGPRPSQKSVKILLQSTPSALGQASRRRSSLPPSASGQVSRRRSSLPPHQQFHVQHKMETDNYGGKFKSHQPSSVPRRADGHHSPLVPQGIESLQPSSLPQWAEDRQTSLPRQTEAHHLSSQRTEAQYERRHSQQTRTRAYKQKHQQSRDSRSSTESKEELEDEYDSDDASLPPPRPRHYRTAISRSPQDSRHRELPISSSEDEGIRKTRSTRSRRPAQTFTSSVPEPSLQNQHQKLKVESSSRDTSERRPNKLETTRSKPSSPNTPKFVLRESISSVSSMESLDVDAYEFNNQSMTHSVAVDTGGFEMLEEENTITDGSVGSEDEFESHSSRLLIPTVMSKRENVNKDVKDLKTKKTIPIRTSSERGRRDSVEYRHSNMTDVEISLRSSLMYEDDEDGDEQKSRRKETPVDYVFPTPPVYDQKPDAHPPQVVPATPSRKNFQQSKQVTYKEEHQQQQQISTSNTNHDAHAPALIIERPKKVTISEASRSVMTNANCTLDESAQSPVKIKTISVEEQPLDLIPSDSLNHHKALADISLQSSLMYEDDEEDKELSMSKGTINDRDATQEERDLVFPMPSISVFQPEEDDISVSPTPSSRAVSQYSNDVTQTQQIATMNQMFHSLSTGDNSTQRQSMPHQHSAILYAFEEENSDQESDSSEDDLDNQEVDVQTLNVKGLKEKAKVLTRLPYGNGTHSINSNNQDEMEQDQTQTLTSSAPPFQRGNAFQKPKSNTNQSVDDTPPINKKGELENGKLINSKQMEEREDRNGESQENQVTINKLREEEAELLIDNKIYF